MPRQTQSASCVRAIPHRRSAAGASAITQYGRKKWKSPIVTLLILPATIGIAAAGIVRLIRLATEAMLAIARGTA